MEEIRKLTAPLTTAPHNSREGGSSFVGGALPYNAMTTKHTKGEWEIVRFQSSIFIESDNGERAELSSFKNGDSLEANAKLIAAAPDLLEALYFFLEKHIELVNSGDAGF